MKKLFYFEKYVKIHRTFQKLLKNVKKFSSTTKSFNDCQKSLNKLFIYWKNNENSIKNSFFVSSLSLFNLTAIHQILFFFNIFFKRNIFAIKRNNTTNWISCSISIWFNWCFNFSWMRLKNFKKIKIQKQSWQIHFTHLKWLFMIVHILLQNKQ